MKFVSRHLADTLVLGRNGSSARLSLNPNFMPGAHQELDHAEHVSHAGEHGSNNKLFGMTMALTGVLIAFCAAMVGSERNELIKAMVKQTQANSYYTAASTKFRLVLLELEKQHARVSSARDTPGAWSPVQRFVELASDYSAERSLSKQWADSYEALVEAHFGAAEGYEHAQLIAEIAIVLASLAVLLSNRLPWFLSIVLAALCILQAVRVYLPTRHIAELAESEVSKAARAYDTLRKAHGAASEDEKTIDQFDPDRKIRNARERQRTETQSAPIEEKHAKE